ncbi:MAG: hypothetical protein Q9173_004573 [Seirophora scorigena]
MVRSRSPFSLPKAQYGGGDLQVNYPRPINVFTGLLPPLPMLGPKVRVEDQIIVAGNDDFIPVRLVGEPCQLRLDLREGTLLSEITGMEEISAGWNRKLSTVGIGDADNIDRPCWWRA